MNPMSSLNNGLNAFDYNRRAGKFHKKPDRPVRVERLHESSKGSQVNEETKHVGGAAEHSEGSNPGFLCYRPLQQEDLDYYLKNAEFPSTDGYILTGSSVSYSTPPIQDRRIPVDFNDPESSLRSAAKAFKSSPSIIRKRKQPTSGQSLNSDHDHAPSEEISNYSRNNPNNSLSSCRETKFNCISRSNARKLFLSPQKCQKL